jgi:hypothetical protein
MQTAPASNRMFSFLVLYDMHSDYFHRVLDGIKDEDRHNRLNTKANHIAWLAGSLVEQRYEIANMLGLPDKQQAHELFVHNKGIQDGVEYPPLEQYKKDWDAITPKLKDLLQNISDEKLDEKFEMMPGFKMSYYELMSFVVYREANCIGQLALWRRLLGYEGMKYM